jgi:hypothetical protein
MACRAAPSGMPSSLWDPTRRVALLQRRRVVGSFEEYFYGSLANVIRQFIATGTDRSAAYPNRSGTP